MRDLPMDSIVCFGGEDWWYHNRGHFDMQIMRQLSKYVPVLFVNSIGMRIPRPGRGSAFLARVRRKLDSVRRGIVEVEPGLHIFSPLHVPGNAGRKLSMPLLRRQILAAMTRLQFDRPLLWVAVPSAGDLIDSLPHVALVYQRTDHFEAFPGVDQDDIRSLDTLLKRRADLTVFCAGAMLEAERHQCRRAEFIDHGVDFERFVAGSGAPTPDDLKSIPRPRVGFIGSIDPHTFDPSLFRAVVAHLPDVQFVLVGGSTLPNDWIAASNVHRLGQKPYDEVWRYPGACDVLIMPWNRSAWIRYCNPVKLKEYLAAGKPVVSTSFEELKSYRGLVCVADDAESFAQAVRAALAAPGGDLPLRQRARVRNETWSRKSEQLIAALRDGTKGD